MATINDLIAQVSDEGLRTRLEAEVKKMAKQKKFGLVFEEHLPECTPLYGLKIKRGSTVARPGAINNTFTVLKVEGDTAVCKKKTADEIETIPLADLIPVAEFGEPIYPYLQPIDSICNAPDSDLWHTLIEADNYHALQLLEYLYAGKVDCIYIDPPYNTGAKDWKYNNDYVDGADTYRHSKWLSMMQKRLKIAKKLLNPADSVLIVTIDEKEYLHLGCLLEEMFPEARMQMVSCRISPQGNQRKNQFSRNDEYIFFVQLGNSAVQRLPLSDEWRANEKDQRTTHLLWSQLIRGGANGTRLRSPKCFYPIYVSKDGKKFVGVGEPLLPVTVHPNDIPQRDDVITIWPYHKNKVEGCWGYSPSNLLELQKKGYVKLGKLNNDGTLGITILQKGMVEKVENGYFKIDGYNEDGSIISTNEYRSFITNTQWRITSHDASRHGSNLLQSIFNDRRFSFPKSLYAVHDTIRFYIANKPNALILDFFAGSGTTMHAVNLLNAEDGGQRRCIMVTNNEISADEEKEFKKEHPECTDKDGNIIRSSDKFIEYQNNLGIARYVTWPRTVCSIKGENIKGEPLKGNYIGSDIPMSDGFKANANFFKLGFLDKNAVALGRQFKEMLPTLWMKAGAIGKCPEVEDEVPDYLILPENKMAILNDENYFSIFEEKLSEYPQIETVYLVTDYEPSFSSMTHALPGKTTFQLYRDYLDNFRINVRRA